MAISLQAAREVLAGESDRDALARNAPTAVALIVGAITAAKAFGALIVIVLIGAVLPVPEEVRAGDRFDTSAIVVGVVYALVASGVGIWLGLRVAAPVIEYFRSGGRRTRRRARRCCVSPSRRCNCRRCCGVGRWCCSARSR